MKKMLFYRVVPHNGGVVFAEPDRAKFVARLCDDHADDWLRRQSEAERLAWPEIGREYVQLAHRVLAEREDAA